jgi:hypothetical protein
MAKKGESPMPKLQVNFTRSKAFFMWGVLSMPTIFFPLVNYVFIYQFYPVIGYFEGKTREEIKEEMKAKLLTMYSFTFKVSLVGFLVSLTHSKLLLGLIFLYYAAGMSYLAHGKMEQED